MERLPLLEETIRFWQPRVSRQLTDEDARQMVENVTGFSQHSRAGPQRQIPPNPNPKQTGRLHEAQVSRGSGSDHPQ